jgi:hypothetical protein
VSSIRAIGLSLALCLAANAQPWESGPGPINRLDTLPGVHLRFERMLNTFSWSGGAVVDIQDGPWAFRADQRLAARLIRAGRSLRQEEWRGRIDLDRAFTESWGGVVQQRSSSVAGPSGADLGEVSQHQLLGGIRFGSPTHSRLVGLVGFEWNRQLGRNDAGPSGGVEGELPGVVWEEILMQGRGRWSASDLGDRQPADAAVELSLLRPFSEGSSYALTASYEAQRRDLPAVGSGLTGAVEAGAGALLRREERSAGVHQSLTWSVDPTLRGSLNARWSDRRIERRFSVDDGPVPTGIHRSELSASGRLTWTPGASWWNDVSLGFAQGEEQHEVLMTEGIDAASLDEPWRQARRRNHQTQRLDLAVRSGIRLTGSTDLTVSASSNILRYDTPDSLNTDDRDELLLTATVEITHRFGPRLALHMAADGAFDHLVFLSRFQSANNVIVRTLRFAPAVVWGSYGGPVNVMRAEVAASYSAFDFEDQVGGIQSYSYRQAMWGDSLVLPVGRSIQLEFTGSLRLFERGLFRWSDFRERPERSFVELALWPRIRVVRWSSGSVAVGFRSFRQERTAIRDGVRVFDGVIGSSGPTVDLSFGWPSARLSLAGWRETQVADGRTLATISNVMLQVRTPL